MKFYFYVFAREKLLKKFKNRQDAYRYTHELFEYEVYEPEEVKVKFVAVTN